MGTPGFIAARAQSNFDELLEVDLGGGLTAWLAKACEHSQDAFTVRIPDRQRYRMLECLRRVATPVGVDWTNG